VLPNDRTPIENTIRRCPRVAEWLLRLWTEKPEWLARMPDRKEVDDPIGLIVAGANQQSAVDRA